MKNKSSYSCSNCSYKSVKWIGCCPGCQEWSSFLEDGGNDPRSSKFKASSTKKAFVHKLADIDVENSGARMLSGIQEWDRVLGGGIVPGSFLVLTGDPGIGKSTLLLQVAAQLAKDKSVYYFSSEESLSQVKGRATRIVQESNNLLFSDSASLEEIISTVQADKPHVVIIDSIQNCYSSNTQTFPGTVGQLREAGFELMRLAKENNVAVIATGHITKDGQMAGPKTLEHMVDAVFYLQGEDRWYTRILRSVKNRFGAINEVGFFEMAQDGLKEISDINKLLLSDISSLPGSVLVSYIEGSRPLLVEIQALVVPTKFTVPQRVVTGVDHKQVVLIAAILEKYLQIKLSAHDIFFKVSNGLKIRESSADLAIALALLSSYFQQALPEKSLALGEISLTGQVRPINQVDTHIKEAKKFGIENIFLADNQKKSNLKYFRSVYELVKLFANN